MKKWGGGIQGFRLPPCCDPAALDPRVRGAQCVCIRLSEGPWAQGTAHARVLGVWQQRHVSPHAPLIPLAGTLVTWPHCAAEGAGKYGWLLREPNRLGEHLPTAHAPPTGLVSHLMFPSRPQPSRACFPTPRLKAFHYSSEIIKSFSCLWNYACSLSSIWETKENTEKS